MNTANVYSLYFAALLLAHAQIYVMYAFGVINPETGHCRY